MVRQVARGQGVLVPTRVSKDLRDTLISSAIYRFHGAVESGAHGETIAISTYEVDRLDRR